MNIVTFAKTQALNYSSTKLWFKTADNPKSKVMLKFGLTLGLKLNSCAKSEFKTKLETEFQF